MRYSRAKLPSPRRPSQIFNHNWHDPNKKLISLRRENKQLEAKLKALTEERSKEEASRDDKKIELLGAKAIAEFQVDQLNRRLDKLQADLGAKDNEFASIRQTAEQRESQIEELTRQHRAIKS